MDWIKRKKIKGHFKSTDMVIVAFSYLVRSSKGCVVYNIKDLLNSGS